MVSQTAVVVIFFLITHAASYQNPSTILRSSEVVEIAPEHGFPEDVGQCLEDTATSKYELIKPLGAGSYGRTWLVRSRCSQGKINYVFKSMSVEKNPLAYMSGIREIYFGEKINSMSTAMNRTHNLVRFVEYFKDANSLSVISRYEGNSLFSLLYEVKDNQLQLTNWWWWLKTTPEGNQELKNIMYQMISGIATLHHMNIIHRDLKPSNMAMCFYFRGNCLSNAPTDFNHEAMHLRLIDFGSAIDEYSLKYLYGPNGPSSAGQTPLYSPPESFYNPRWLQEPIQEEHLKKCVRHVLYRDRLYGNFDWNLVVNIDDWNLRYVGLCIGEANQLPSYCKSSQAFMQYIKGRDTSNKGFPELHAMKLAKLLLHADVELRITAEEALKHPYFWKGSFTSGGYRQQGYQAKPPTSQAPFGTPMQQPGYYLQSGAYPGSDPHHDMIQIPNSGYPPQSSVAISHLWLGGDSYGQQQQAPGDLAAPTDNVYNVSLASGYSPGQGYPQDGCGGYHASAPQTGYCQCQLNAVPGYDQQQTCNSAHGYGSVTKPLTDSHIPTCGTQADGSTLHPSTDPPWASNYC